MISRRWFLSGSTLAVAGLAANVKAGEGGNPEPVLDWARTVTPPMLQNPAATTMDIAWGVSALSSGFVELSEESNLANAKRIASGQLPIEGLDPDVLSVRLTGLKPATRYYYRTVTVPINYPVPYKIVPGELLRSPIYTFCTSGEKADSSFAVINDTHNKKETLVKLAAQLAKCKAAVTVWNGDVCDWFATRKDIGSIILNPTGQGEGFAAEHPVLLTQGNHECRGEACRELPEFFLPRPLTERTPQYAELTRNFAIRQGELALIGMDTGEDKPDAHPSWAGLARFEPYRALQTQWLAEALARPEIDSAPYIVVFCHIPLYDKRLNSNTGDTMEGFAAWMRPAARMWSPLFEKHRVQVVIAAHMHRHRFDPPTAERSWAQVVGGGYSLTDADKQATVIEGRIKGGELVITAHGMQSNNVLGEYRFKPRT